MSSWYKETGPESDVIVSTRIRLARNIEGIPFLSRLSSEKRREINKQCYNALINKSSALSKTLKYIDFNTITDVDAYSLFEKHLISHDFAENRKDRALILSDDSSISIMLGEEDHIRIQVFLPGFSLDEAYDLADKVDTFLGETINFAFDEQLGFLTECPTNLGTGLRASVMLHLPALEANSIINQVASSVSKIGLTIRGMYGEGSKPKASLFQLSNQVTLGISEKSALENLKLISKQIMTEERIEWQKYDMNQIGDMVYRAIGVLRYARILTSDEMMILLSRLKLGISLGIIKDMEQNIPNTLMVEGQPAMLQKKYNVMNISDRDLLRAKYVREKVTSHNI